MGFNGELTRRPADVSWLSVLSSNLVRDLLFISPQSADNRVLIGDFSRMQRA